MKKKIYYLLKKTAKIISITILCQTANAQSLGSWNILNAKLKINQTWSVFAEAQVRSIKFYDYFNYHEIKGGANFQPIKSVIFTLGAGKYDTYNEIGNFSLPKNRTEIRLWPQVQFNQQINNFRLENRLRSEFRFSPSGYRNRFRNRLGLIYPLKKNKEGKNVLEIGVYNELFFTNTAPYFERNRASVNLNYKISKQSAVTIGYLEQFDYKINDETGRRFLQIGYFHEFVRKKK